MENWQGGNGGCVMITFYSFAYLLALPIFFPFEFLKRPRELRPLWLSEKIGAIRTALKRSGPVIWIHAVSVGEVLAAIPLINKLKGSGYHSIVLSTITDTGRQMAIEKAPDGVTVMYLPFDLKIFLNRAIRRISPSLFMTMETELWPNLLSAMEKAGVPVCIFNGRISDRSFPRYRKIRFFLRRLFRGIRCVGMQTQQDAVRILDIGMAPEKVHLTGNFKFDIHGSITPPVWLNRLKGTVLVAGSTHEGEEEIILDCWQRLKEKHAPLTLILAPRHPNRFGDVERLLQSKELSYIKRSGMNESVDEISDCVILIDVIGELAGIYSAGDICIIGGSFVPIGGHNLFEAAYWSKPIVCGPHMNNFPLITNFTAHKAVRIANAGNIYDIVSALLDSPAERKTLGEKAYRLFTGNSGAVDKALDLLKPILEQVQNERP